MDSAERVSVLGSDSDYSYSPEEEARLTQNLSVLINGVSNGFFSHLPLTTRLLQVLHENIFKGIRSHAGKIRNEYYGSEYLDFGPHRSCHRNTVPKELERLFSVARDRYRELADDPDRPDFEEASIDLALWVHAETIRIHPFEDGNGRSSRALLDVILVKLGLRVSVFDAPKQEYLACLNHFYTSSDLLPLRMLLVSLYE